ncbi:MAG: toll/interleukin-1 receptor domain-containing protein, partial [Pyrinomonadaceae bacterium]
FGASQRFDSLTTLPDISPSHPSPGSHTMADQRFKYDVYISYAMPDAEWCDGLGRRLGDEGVRVWFDKWELEPGDNLAAKLDEARTESRVIIPVLSRSYFRGNTSRVEAELFIKQHADPTSGLRLIPVLIDDFEIPPDYRNVIYIDFRDPEQFEGNVRRLLEQINKTEEESAPPVVKTEPPKVWLSTMTTREAPPAQIEHEAHGAVRVGDRVVLAAVDDSREEEDGVLYGIYEVESAETVPGEKAAKVGVW